MDPTLSQAEEWKVLYEQLHDLLLQHGKESPYGDEDFWLVDDNWGSHQHKVCVNRMEFLTPRLVEAVRQLIASEFPRWAVLLSFDFPDIDVGVPESGLSVTASEVRQCFDRERLQRLFKEKFRL